VIGMSFSYNRITYYTRGGPVNSYASKEGITKEDAIKRMVYYLKRMPLDPSCLITDYGQLHTGVNQKTLASLYSSEAWIEKEGGLDSEEVEAIRDSIAELYHGSTKKEEDEYE